VGVVLYPLPRRPGQLRRDYLTREHLGHTLVLVDLGWPARFYDAPGGDSVRHLKRPIGLAWLELPLQAPGCR
jgi:hypothetical protein